MKEKELKNELGRYKKKVEDQQKEIRGLKENIEGYKEIQRINDAILASVLDYYKHDAENPFAATKEDIKSKLENVTVVGIENENKDGYLIHVELKKKGESYD